MSGPEGAGPGVDLLAESEDQAALRQLARDVATREVAPRAQVGDEEGVVPAEVRKALAAADLLRITVGERWGGMGLGDVEASIVLEEIARADVSSAICCQLTFNGPPRGIEHLGPEAMQERWLPAVADGDALISIGITEPDAGSAVQNMRAALSEDGPGRWRLNAYKNYSTLGDVAQGVLVWCRWPGGEGAKGIGAVIVPTDREGVSVTGRHKGMGIHAATEAELAFDGVEITADDVLLAGDPSNTEAFKVLLSHLNHERCGNASMCVGAAQGSLEHAVRYMNERVIGGRPLAELQGLQWKLADMAVQLEGARLLLARAVRLAGPGGTPPALETAMAKTAANLAAKFVCDEAMQIHGGYGYSREYPLERAPTATSGACASAPGRWRRSAITSACASRRACGPGLPGGGTRWPVRSCAPVWRAGPARPCLFLLRGCRAQVRTALLATRHSRQNRRSAPLRPRTRQIGSPRVPTCTWTKNQPHGTGSTRRPSSSDA